jgi:AraC family transcriptional regulator of adaptative response / methylphosphotriester-DNA alkyltransferase methyltransferase
MAINEGFRPCKRCRPDLLEPPNEEDVILTAQSIIEKEYASALTLDQLSKQVGMSKYHLHRTFKKIVGVTPMEYMTKIRISKSAELLMQTDLSITQIAHEVGYRSSSHFNVIFRNHLGCSPTVYRHQQHKGD